MTSYPQLGINKGRIDIGLKSSDKMVTGYKVDIKNKVFNDSFPLKDDFQSEMDLKMKADSRV